MKEALDQYGVVFAQSMNLLISEVFYNPYFKKHWDYEAHANIDYLDVSIPGDNYLA